VSLLIVNILATTNSEIYMRDDDSLKYYLQCLLYAVVDNLLICDHYFWSSLIVRVSKNVVCCEGMQV
jgi:hypothetical protein